MEHWKRVIGTLETGGLEHLKIQFAGNRAIGTLENGNWIGILERGECDTGNDVMEYGKWQLEHWKWGIGNPVKNLYQADFSF